MSKILIKDVGGFNRFLGAITRLVDSCKFEIGPDACCVKSINDTKTVRAFFTTNVVTSDDKLSFCLNEIGRLHRSMGTLAEFAPKKDGQLQAELNFDGTFLSLKDRIKFKLTLVDEEVVRKYVTRDLQTKLEPSHGLVLGLPMMKKLCSLAFITSAERPKVYMYREDNNIVGEIDEKNQRLSNSIGIPISAKHFGSWESPIICQLETFRLWNLLDAKQVQITMTKQKAVVVINKIEEGETWTKIKIVSQVLGS